MQSMNFKVNFNPGSDPAPSRLSYKFQRLWLTPSFRVIVKILIPLSFFLFFITLILSSGKTFDHLKTYFVKTVDTLADRPELSVKLISIPNVSKSLKQTIRSTIPVNLPISSLDLDLKNIRETIQSLEAVKSVDVQVIAGGILNINVVERSPKFVWRNPDGLFLIDDEGTIVRKIQNRVERSDLIFLTGVGADTSSHEIIGFLDLLKQIEGRIVAFSRISEDRWNIILDQNQMILLPSESPEMAIHKFLILNDTQDILNRNISRIDLRNQKRLTVTIESNKIKKE